MTAILRRLPYFDEEFEADSPDGPAAVRAFQIIVWVSLSVKGVTALDPRTPRFPAILDTGNTHNLSLRQDHLERWAGLPLATLPGLGHVFLGARKIPLAAANAWIHPNRPGERDVMAGKSPVCLELDEGIAVDPHGQPSLARLPLLGLRALTRNDLKLIIDGKRREVSLKTAGWF
jgi:hypothetical protein